jgi:hypothetical protein
MKRLIRRWGERLFLRLTECKHNRTSFPQTPRRAPGYNGLLPKYVTCLDCGKRFEYDWEKMEVKNVP